MDIVNQYKNIYKALEFYKGLGYTCIDTPWVVDDSIINITKPKDRKAINVPFLNGSLVGSGEQGFIKLVLNGELQGGNYVTVTPCFRDEPFIDALHRNYFMKCELISIGRFRKDPLNLLMDAYRYFVTVVQHPEELEVITIDHKLSYDLNYKEIEIGSYGANDTNDIGWTFGTGIAEPRLSTIEKIY